MITDEHSKLFLLVIAFIDRLQHPDSNVGYISGAVVVAAALQLLESYRCQQQYREEIGGIL